MKTKRTLASLFFAGFTLAATAEQRIFPVDGDTHVAEDISGSGDLEVTASGIGTLFLDGAVSAGGTLTLSTEADTFSWGSADSTTYVRADDILVAPGKTLAQWTVSGGYMKGGAITAGEAYAYRLEYGDGTLTLNMCRQDGVNVKMRKLQFTDTDEGIVVRSLYKSYKTTTDMNTDFDNDPEAIAHQSAGSSSGYEVSRIDFVERVDSTWLKPTKSVTANALTLGDATQVAFTDGATLGTDGTFAGTISGTSTSRLSFGPATVTVGETKTADSLNGVESGTNPRVPSLIIRNCRVSDILGVSDASQHQGSITFDPVQVHFFTNDGIRAECQVQGYDEGSLCKVAFLTLFQNGSDIYGVINKCMWALKATYPMGTDFRTLSGAPGVSESTANSYPVSGFKITVRDVNRPSYTLTGKASMANATWTVSTNATVAVSNSSATPKGGTVEIQKDGSLDLLVRQNGSLPNYVVGPGGVLAQCCENGVADYASMTIDGGILSLSDVSYSSATHSDDCGSYLYSLTLRNGARITGLPPRLCGGSAVTWTIDGTSPSTCETGLKLVQTSGSTSVLTFDVADVTGSAATDFTVTGKVYDMGDLKGTSLVKTGAGTMRLGNVCTCAGSTFTVSAGTLLLGNSAALNANQPVILSGGTVSVEDALAVSASTLTVAADSGLALGSGASLAFSGLADWTDGAKLTLTGPETTVGKRTGIRIGTAACLTDAQLKLIRYNGARVIQDSEGYLVPNKRGMIIMFL